MRFIVYLTFKSGEKYINTPLPAKFLVAIRFKEKLLSITIQLVLAFWSMRGTFIKIHIIKRHRLLKGLFFLRFLFSGLIGIVWFHP